MGPHCQVLGGLWGIEGVKWAGAVVEVGKKTLMHPEGSIDLMTFSANTTKMVVIANLLFRLHGFPPSFFRRDLRLQQEEVQRFFILNFERKHDANMTNDK